MMKRQPANKAGRQNADAGKAPGPQRRGATTARSAEVGEGAPHAPGTPAEGPAGAAGGDAGSATETGSPPPAPPEPVWQDPAGPLGSTLTFLVPGTSSVLSGARGSGTEPSLQRADEPRRIKASVRLGGGLRGDTSLSRVDAVLGQDIVRLELADGTELRLHPNTARELLAGPPLRQTDAARRTRQRHGPQEVAVPALLRWPAADTPDAGARGGLGDLLDALQIRVFEVLTGPLKERAAEVSADLIAGIIDARVRPGVYALPREGPLASFRDSGARPLAHLPPPPGGRPILVLIHGTFVDTSSTFGALWDDGAERARRLHEAYGGAVYALDHRTLTASPVQNLGPLVQALPDDAVLHLLTHSRGGLVAEVLARLAATDTLSAEDIQALGVEGQTPAEDIHALHAQIRGKRIRVDRVVRVACPARGTLLASGRLDVYLSALVWLLRQAAVPLLPELIDFLDAVAQQRTDPSKLPGLQIQMPSSGLVRWLNRRPPELPGDLRVIAGDLAADSVAGFFKTLLADAFYRTDNDVVVHTSAMYGGAPRQGGASFLLHRSGEATHFAYFRQERTATAVLAGLIDPRPTDFQPIGLLSWSGEASDGVRGAAAAAGADDAEAGRPLTIVVPDILCSHLADPQGRRVWLDRASLGNLDALAWTTASASQLMPDGAMEGVIGPLVRYLRGRGHAVQVFDYDWRGPLEPQAQRLAARIRGAIDARAGQPGSPPVRLLAHGMGGLVARAVQLTDATTWDLWMGQPDSRLLMLGTPHAGSWMPMQWLSGDDDLGQWLTAAAMPGAASEARQLLAQLPGLLALQAGLLDDRLGLGQAATWADLARQDLDHLRSAAWWHRNIFQRPDNAPSPADLAWGLPDQAVLDQAVAFWRRLDAQRDSVLSDVADRLKIVVGTAEFTPAGHQIDPEAGFGYTGAPGDGRVTLASALLPGVRAWSAAEEHGRLPCLATAFEAYAELLERGDTSRLPRVTEFSGASAAPAQARQGSAAEPQATAPRARPLRGISRPVPPALADLLLAPGRGTAPGRGRAGRSLPPPLHVQVINGNLSYVAQPLFIGHYTSLALAGAERVVDEQIGGTMSEALELQAGHYPEAIGQHQAFINRRRQPDQPDQMPKPSAVVVVGLGPEGWLTERDLTNTVRQAVLDWLQRHHESTSPVDGRPASSAAPVQPVQIAATLIGSGGFGITAGASARAIVQAVQDANRRVHRVGWATVTQLSLIELYMDRAADAWRELRLLADNAAAAGEAFALDRLIGRGNGGRRRPLDGGYRGADYDLVRISGQAEGRLEFALDTRRARSEVREQGTQVSLVQELVRSAARDHANDRRLGQTLFHLLVPAALEPHFRSQGRLILDMSDSVASIPWELLDTRPDPAQAGQPGEPWALRSGLLRKLQSRSPAGAGRRDALTDDDVLVIGDPLLTRQDEYRPLQHAYREAEQVAAVFAAPQALGADRVVPLLRRDALEIANALYERDWRIIHIAGHGEWQQGRGGVVLSGPRTYLGPDEVQAMRSVPELVFINCCHLASLEGDDRANQAMANLDRGEFAAGVASALIRNGVRCVVAAGWAVDDEAAQIFATTFYRQLLAGATFGDAVTAARRVTYLHEQTSGGRTSTWAAYQCYGDPDWRFHRGQRASQRSRGGPPPDVLYAGIASAAGLVLALESLAQDARWMSNRQERALAHTRWLAEHFEADLADLGEQGAVAAAFGAAFEECGAFDEAIAWYRRAIGSHDGTASFKALETLGNLLSRTAYDMVRRPTSPRPAPAYEEARSRADEALMYLEARTRVFKTSEAYCLVGAAHKRMAMIRTMAGQQPEAAQAVAEAKAAYQTGLDLAQSPGDSRVYPLQNLLAVELREALASPPPIRHSRTQRRVNQRVNAVRQALSARTAQKPIDEWVRLGLIELRLVEALLLAVPGTRLQDALDELANLQRSVPGRKVWRSTLDQWEFILQPVAAGARPPGIDQLLDQLERYAA